MSFSQNKTQSLPSRNDFFEFLLSARISSEPIWGLSALRTKNTIICSTPDNIKVYGIKSSKKRHRLKERYKLKSKIFFKGHFEILEQDDIDTIKQKIDSKS